MATEPLPPPCDWPRDACHFSGEIQSLRDKNDALRAELAESREQLTRELKIALEAKSALRARVAELEARRSLPMDSITITIAEWDRVTGERDRLRAEVDAFREDAANYYRIAKEADAQQAALRARVAEAVRMIEGYKRAGWLTNPAAAEQATDFINRASGNKSLQRIEGE